MIVLEFLQVFCIPKVGHEKYLDMIELNIYYLLINYYYERNMTHFSDKQLSLVQNNECTNISKSWFFLNFNSLVFSCAM